MRWARAVLGMCMALGALTIGATASAKDKHASKARTQAGVYYLKPIDIRAYPQRPVAAIDIQKRRVTAPTATRTAHFVSRIAPTVHTQPF